MSDHNPFAVSEHAGSGQNPGMNDPHMHPAFRELIQLLVETRPWVRFLSILMIIGAVFMLIGGAISTLVLGGIGGRLGFLGVFYLIFSLLYIYPAVCLMRYASAISEAESNGQMVTVNEAVMHQKKFWRFCGIVAAVILTFYILILVLSFTVGAVGFMF